MTENGWQPSPRIEPDSPLLVWRTVPGTNVTLQVRNDDIGRVMLALAADYHAYIAPLRDADSACYTPTNSVATSNHLNATAMDLNWNDHPFQKRGSFTPEQLATTRELVGNGDTDGGFYEGWMFWAGYWDDPVDEMHWQAGYGTYGRDAELADFIRRKIRPDGFSTFRRDNPAPEPDAAAVLAAATGLSRDRAAQILPAVQSGIALSECTTVNRIAMWLAQIGHESDNFNATEEYDKGDGGLTERWKYLGRTWIQITWRSNYAGFSQWAFERGICPTPTYFVDNPAELADLRYAGDGPAWYWTVARPQINAMCDSRDLIGVTRAINGGTNGLDDRTARWNRALAQGDALLTLTTDGDDMFTDADRDLLKQIAEYRRESRSRLRWPHQGPVDTCAGFAWNADAFGHEASVDRLATTYGDPWAIANLYAVINTDEPNREGDIELAKRILAKVPKKFITAANADIQAWLDAEAQYQTADA
ncbi:glycoside hydrolase family 19 protein [Mycobacterium intracellulare]|uniref:Peptidase M15C domain-containing protein n=1 Tax=Mycobacterium intracellulare TaxID=1767 RepID=A0AAE4RG02_MYCIT|nr:hypothetical protein [Mycobacterium intracellulare]MDV6979670.1 hypothetical protein [Mycobacterium intracellulare]MDV6985173.1 hypothetical protein [Mycobacterium intracellulare]MDV7014207.1 hypothetical protein [Mycobacterium intracellulare]MDV7030164.1 hypothetical protein [Mycobacterium intracellulare]